MSNRLEAFQEGVRVDYTCPWGYRGKVSLNKPNDMNRKESTNYISECRDACKQCSFVSHQLCSRMKDDGKAWIESLNGENVKSELRKYKAPCVSRQTLKSKVQSFLRNLT